MTALLFFARLSDHVGRRPVAIATVLLAAGGCLVLVETNGIGLLITGRVLQGLACGLAPGALGAYIVDTVPIKSRWMVPAITGSGSMMSDGWDGHEPVQASHVFIPHLEENGSRIRIAESPAISSCR